MAEGLIAIAAERELRRTDPLYPPAGVYDEFCARFPYTETDDQLKAIDEVLGDLAAGRPMDRLVCGDVGFGKTEVALRAALVAAMQGYQVAVVVPTTRSEEHTSELQSLMRISYAVFCLKKKTIEHSATKDVIINRHYI